MIADSVPWKRDLARQAQSLRASMGRWKKGARISPALYYRMERFCLISPFVIRKLFEAEKLSEEFERQRVKVTVFARRKRGYRPLDVLTKGDVWKRFVLSKSFQRSITVETLCNILIHSTDLVFGLPTARSRGFVMVSSARHAREIYLFKLEILLSVVKHAVRDDIVHARYVRDPKTDALVCVERSRKHAVATRGSEVRRW